MPVIEEIDSTLEQSPLPVTEADALSERINWPSVVRVWLQSVVITVVLFFFLITFVVQGFAVSGSCMEPNLLTGERILGSKFIYRFKAPERGDIVIFSYPKDPKRAFIKRVVGLPGETIEIRQGRVFIDERPLVEPYLVHTAHGDYGPRRIKEGNLFVMGDYRDNSRDSREWGELPIKNIRAKAWVRYWPTKRIDVLK